MTAATAQGSDVTFAVADDGVKINDANIVTTDILATNGVIHVIDSVLLPPAPEAEAEAAPAEAAPAEASPTEAAPEALPATGGSAPSGVVFALAAILVAVLAGFALLTGRRTA
jgi:hypothetical protein